jgi:hypothetical protein
MPKSKINGVTDVSLNRQGAGAHPGSIKTGNSPKRNTATEPSSGGVLGALAIELGSRGKGSSSIPSSLPSHSAAERSINYNAGKKR